MYTATHAKANTVTKNDSFYISSLDINGQEIKQYAASIVDVFVPINNPLLKNTMDCKVKDGFVMLIHKVVISPENWGQLVCDVNSDMMSLSNSNLYPVNTTYNYQLSVFINGFKNDAVLRNIIDGELEKYEPFWNINEKIE
jgi:hypothetical protein